MARRTQAEDKIIRKQRYRALAVRLLDIEIRVGNNVPITPEERRLLDIRIVRRRRELIRVQGIRSNRSNQRSISSNQTNQPISDPTTRTSLAETNLSESPLLGIRSVRNRRTDTSNVTNQEST